MGKDIKAVKVAYKIDMELIDELYKKAKEKEGEERRKLLKKALALSKHIGKYLTIDI